MRNTLFVAVAFSAFFSTVNAQNLKYIPSIGPSIEEQFGETNSLKDEGTTPIRELNGLYENCSTQTTPSASDLSNSTPYNNEVVDSSSSSDSSSISDDEVQAMEYRSSAWKQARSDRTFFAPKAKYSIASLRAIYPNNEQKVREIAYGTKKMTKQTKSAEARIANGW